MRPVVISLFDFTGEAVRPWADAGYDCYCYDLQHQGLSFLETDGGVISFVPWDADDLDQASAIVDLFAGRDVAMVFGWPPCTDLAASGAKHWAAKRMADPAFQSKAVARAKLVKRIADCLSAPYLIENPRGALCTLWRKPDHCFNPCDFGGYLEAGSEHPRWPDFIPAQDAYTKLTCLWTGNGFVMPTKRPVEPVIVELTRKDGRTTKGSPQWAKLGGKSLRTKNIRSATPRGFAKAVMLANHLNRFIKAA